VTPAASTQAIPAGNAARITLVSCSNGRHHGLDAKDVKGLARKHPRPGAAENHRILRPPVHGYGLAAQIENLHLHDLRHSSRAETTNRYAHLAISVARDVVGRVGEIVSNASKVTRLRRVEYLTVRQKVALIHAFRRSQESRLTAISAPGGGHQATRPAPAE
jgi:hypothetical protein